MLYVIPFAVLNEITDKCVKVTRGIHTDCLLNYETVKYFNGEQHESARYEDAIRHYQAVEYQVLGMCNRCINSNWS